MPHSWLRIPTTTSPAMDRCMGGDKSRARSCAELIAEQEGALVLAFHWEKGKVGESALAHLWAPTQEQLDAAARELGGEPVAELDEFTQVLRGDDEAASY